MDCWMMVLYYVGAKQNLVLGVCVCVCVCKWVYVCMGRYSPTRKFYRKHFADPEKNNKSYNKQNIHNIQWKEKRSYFGRNHIIIETVFVVWLLSKYNLPFFWMHDRFICKVSKILYVYVCICMGIRYIDHFKLNSWHTEIYGF